MQQHELICEMQGCKIEDNECNEQLCVNQGTSMTQQHKLPNEEHGQDDSNAYSGTAILCMFLVMFSVT